jgi:LAO/AO transport system kinase
MSAVQVLAASHDTVIVESVGVGQSETDIELVSDVTVMIVQPASGDTLQFLKAGILEIPDIFVVNKADLGEVAQRAYQELVSCIRAIGSVRGSTEEPRVVRTSASTGEGIVELADAIEVEFDRNWASGRIERKRESGMLAWCERGVNRRIGEQGVMALGGRERVRGHIRELLGEGISSVRVVQRLGMESLSAIRNS